VDRWIAHQHRARLRAAPDPLVVDLGYGASPATTLELSAALRRIRPDLRVVGVENDRERVTHAQQAVTGLDAPGVTFVHGGFELAGLRPVLARAMNVLRQYDEAAVAPAWQRMVAALAPGGALVEGTCDELGRRHCWVMIDADGPRTLTLAAHLPSLSAPSDLAPRLPKALIHRNVPGERVHALLTAADAAWAATAPYATFGPRQHWIRTCVELREQGWPVRDGARRWRLGELTLDWSAVRPSGG